MTRVEAEGSSGIGASRSAALLSWLVLLGALLVVVTVRVRLTSLPLERDEGEYAYVGYWLLRGVPPYESGANMKFPGVYLAWAGMMALFGESLRSIRIGILAVDLLLAAGLFLSVRRFASTAAARVSAAAALLLLADSGTLALYGHATRFVVAGVVLGLLCMTSTLREPLKQLLAGVAFGLALLAKQHALFFVIFVVVWAFLASAGGPVSLRIRRALACVAGVALPVAAVALWLGASGVLQKAWFWTMEYSLEYVGLVGLRGGLVNLGYSLRQMATGSLALWLFGLAAAVALWPKRSAIPRWTFPLLLVSALSVVPGLHFREHYFITLVPVIAILIGLTVDHLAKPAVAALLVIGVASFAVANQAGTYFVKSPEEITRLIYPTNPFSESIPVGAYIASHTERGDRIAVLGSEPQLYFYAGRRSASEFLYMYPLVERHPFALRMQRAMCEQLRRAAPKFVVAVQVNSSWLGGGEPPRELLDCMTPYLRERYALVGVVDMDDEKPVYVWGADAAMRHALGKRYMLVFERKSI